jgi:SAM-dependent methyltransferase
MPSFLVPVALVLALQATTEAPPPAPTEQMRQEAAAMEKLVESAFARSFLQGFECLPAITPRVAYYNKETRTALSESAARGMTKAQLSGFEKRDIDEHYYYFTRYGTPVAFTRPVEILGHAGLKSADGLKLVDFGFGSIGQLRALAALGADAVGVEVDRLLEVIYAGDTGRVPRCEKAGKGREGSVNLVFGQFPAEKAVVDRVGSGYDAFISKNTLKRGYVHPEREADPRALVHLMVDDETFVSAIYDLLKPGGLALIYNLCPAPSKPEEKYKPWADGRSPFTRELWERVGFAVIAFDVDDTEAAREMGRTLGWGTEEELGKDLFGVYTLLRKPL